MANFPYASSTIRTTGFVQGTNAVSCPQQCQLFNGSGIYNKDDAFGGPGNYNNIYDIDDIGGYYCAIYNGPPLNHTAAPEGYESNYYLITSNDWGSGFSTEEVPEDEVYTNPRTNYMFQNFNSSATCVNRVPPTDNPVPTLPTRDCQAPQSTLTWFRLNNCLFK